MFDAVNDNFYGAKEYIQRVGVKNVTKEEWEDISKHIYKMPIIFIADYACYLNWFYITQNQYLDESTIEKYHFLVYWQFVAKHQRLSESFMEKFANFLNWEDVSLYQEMSVEFIKKHMNKLNIEMVQKNDNCGIHLHSQYVVHKTGELLKKEIIL